MPMAGHFRNYRVVKKIPEDKKVRFDVVAIEGGQIRWYKNAFAYSG